MIKTLIAAAAATTLIGSVSLTAAEAMPMASPAPAPVASDHAGVTLVAGGCGIGFHRGPYGGCRPNRGWHRPVVRRCFVRHTPWGWRRVCRW